MNTSMHGGADATDQQLVGNGQPAAVEIGAATAQQTTNPQPTASSAPADISFALSELSERTDQNSLNTAQVTLLAGGTSYSQRAAQAWSRSARRLRRSRSSKASQASAGLQISPENPAPVDFGAGGRGEAFPQAEREFPRALLLY